MTVPEGFGTGGGTILIIKVGGFNLAVVGLASNATNDVIQDVSQSA